MSVRGSSGFRLRSAPRFVLASAPKSHLATCFAGPMPYRDSGGLQQASALDGRYPEGAIPPFRDPLVEGSTELAAAVLQSPSRSIGGASRFLDRPPSAGWT